MPIPKNSEKAVSILQKRLLKARENIKGPINQSNREFPMLSRFTDVDTKLQDLKRHFPGVIKHWENKVLAKFIALEHHICKILSNSKDKTCNIEADLELLGKRIDDLNNHVLLSSKALQLPALEETSLMQSGVQRSQPEDASAAGQKLSQEWLNRRVEEEIFESPAMSDLQASYNNLDSLELRLCCLFFSVFPENAVIKKRPLIYWWISEGLIMETKNKTVEEVGEDMFSKLIKLGLIEPYFVDPEKPSPAVNACRMHPWIRYMLISLARGAQLFDFNSLGTPCYNVSKSRRACLVSNSSVKHQSSSGNNAIKEENLSTVFNLSEQYLDFAPDWLLKFKKLVVLQLGRWRNSPKYHIEVENEKFLSGFGAQKHLRYLSFRGISRITELPKSIVELFNLEILDLKACHNLETLPPDIGLLRKLTHIDVSDCPLLEGMPKGLEKLSALQVLKGFVIGNPKQTPCTVADLAKLKKLRRLSIYVGNEAVVREGEFRKLKEIESLHCLTVSWGVKSPASANTTDLSFPPQLEKLCLSGIPRTELKAKAKAKAKEAPVERKEQHPAEPKMKAQKAPADSLETQRAPALMRMYTGLKAKLTDAPADQKDKGPQRRPLEELKPSNLRNLKRLYIRGGELTGLYHEANWVWTVEILQLRYLMFFKIDIQKLLADFPHLIYLDVKCDATEGHKHKEKDQSNKEVEYKDNFVLTKREIERKKNEGEKEDKSMDILLTKYGKYKDKGKSEEQGKHEDELTNGEMEEEIDNRALASKTVWFEEETTFNYKPVWIGQSSH